MIEFWPEENHGTGIAPRGDFQSRIAERWISDEEWPLHYWALISALGVTLVIGFLFAFAGAIIGIVMGLAVGLYSKWELGIADAQLAWFFLFPAVVSSSRVFCMVLG